MPTRDEKLAQVEAAFRARFFPYVPIVENDNRKNWSTSQHDTDRLSRALSAYTLVGMCSMEDADAAGAVTDGERDGGIDAFHFDRAGNRLLVVQAKYKTSGTTPAQEEVLKTINGIRKLQDRKYEDFNDFFQRRLNELEEAFDTVGIRIVVVLAFLGEELSTTALEDLTAFQQELRRFGTELQWQGATLTCICDWLREEQTPKTVSAVLTLENWSKIETPWTAYYGQISAKELAALVQEHSSNLFERNIRYFLGSSEVNDAIVKSVQQKPQELFYLNNGLTAIATSIRTASGTPQRCRLQLEGMSIVNGAQTAGAIAFAGEISPQAKLFLTIIEIKTGQEKIGVRITRARNSQNAVRSLDFAAADANQERLRRELAAIRIAYYYRPSAEAYERKEDAFNIEEAAVALACLSFPVLSNDDIHTQQSRGTRIQNAVDFVVTVSRSKGVLWDRERVEYGQLFTADLAGIRLLRLVRIYRFLDTLLAEAATTETVWSRQTFFRSGRYFVMAFVASRLPDVMRRTALGLSPEERILLSQTVNDLSEEIFMQAFLMLQERNRQSFTHFFNKLEQVQPLADRVFNALKSQTTVRSLSKPQTPDEHPSTEQP